MASNNHGNRPSYAMNDLKTHVRHCLLYDFQLGKSAAESTRNICAAIGQDAVSHSTAKYWFQRFREGDYSLEDRPRSGRPSTLDTQRLHSLINSDPTQTTRSLAEQLDTSHSTVERHLHDQGLEFREGRWLYTGAHSSNNHASPHHTQQHPQQQTAHHSQNNSYAHHPHQLNHPHNKSDGSSFALQRLSPPPTPLPPVPLPGIDHTRNGYKNGWNLIHFC